MSLSGRTRTGSYAALAAVVALGLIGVGGLLLRQPWLFPSLGPTIMVLAETPRQPAARPSNVLVGHTVGVAAGYLALVVTGTTDAAPVVDTGITPGAIVAAAVALAVTSLVLQVLGTPHPPAGATTLIVALALLSSPGELLALLVSVVLVTVVVVALDRLAGVT